MGHDTEAAYASSEIADILTRNQDGFFGNIGNRGKWSIYAGREAGYSWPLADGVIQAENTSSDVVRIAFEFKRPNEGVHGILTAIGQSYAYLEKGYDAAIMAIPAAYSSHSDPGGHANRILESATPDSPISIYTYNPPNLSAARPFENRLTCVREISLPKCRKTGKGGGAAKGGVSTLWAHVREGISHPDVFFRYCQSIKAVTSVNEDLSHIKIPDELVAAVKQLSPDADPYWYLSNTVGDTVFDRSWRHLWFNFMFWQDLMPIHTGHSPYAVNDVKTRIRIDAKNFQSMFSGRSDSIKVKCVNRLNADDSRATREQVWRAYAEKVRNYAHSYREIIDSGLAHIGFVGPDGNLTDLGYKYVEACERYDSTNIGTPLEILRGAFLQNGKFAALLHYIYKYSEERFHADYLSFAKPVGKGWAFDKIAYINWLDDIFVNTLHISRKSTLRAGGSRLPLQAELSYLNKLGLINSYNGRIDYRIGLGISIDWPQVQNSIMFFSNL